MPSLAETFVQIGLDDDSLSPEIQAALKEAVAAAASTAKRGGEQLGDNIGEGLTQGLERGERAIRSLDARLAGLSSGDRSILIRADAAQAESEIRRIDRLLSDPTLTTAEIKVLFDQRGVAQAKIAETGRDIDRFADNAVADLRRVDAAAGRAGTSIGQIAIGSAIGSVAVQGIAAVGRGLAGIVTTGIQAAGSIEQVGVAFTGLLGSADRGTAFVERLQDFAARTPFEFQQLTAATQALLALGNSGDEAIDTLTAVGDAAAAVGAPGESIERVVRAITQISAKGKLSSEELNQIAEALPNLNRADIFDNLAAASGRSEAEIRKLAETGGITAEEAIPALVAALRQVPGAMGAMARQATTLNGLLSTFKDTVKIELTDAFVPLVSLIRESLPEVTEVVGDLIGPLAEGISGIAQGLIPLGIDLARTFGPALTSVIENLGEGFTVLGPGLSEAGELIADLISAAAPLIPQFASIAAGIGSGFLPILQLAVPLLEGLVTVINAIPDPLLQVAATMVIANKAFGGLPGAIGNLRTVFQITSAVAASRGVSTLSAGLTGMGAAARSAGAGIGLLNPYVLAAGAGIAVLGLKLADNAAKERAFRAEVDELTASLKTQDGQIQFSTKGLAAYIDEQSRFDTKNQSDDLDRLGLSAERLGVIARRGAGGMDEFLSAATRAGEVTEVFAGQGNALVDATGRVVGELGSMTTEFGKVEKQGGRMFAGNNDLITSFEELQKVTGETAKAQVLGAVAQERATQAEVDAAIAKNTATDGTIDYVGALGTLSTALQRADSAEAAQAERDKARIERLGTLAEGMLSFADSANLLAEAGPGVSSGLRALTDGSGDTTDEFIRFAIAAGDAELSSEELGAAAGRLGVDAGLLKSDLDQVSVALEGFVDKAMAGLPDVGKVFTDAMSIADDAASAAAEAITEGAADRAQAVIDAGSDSAQAVIDAAAKGSEAAQKAAADRADAIREGAEDNADAIREGAAEQAEAIKDGTDLTVAGLIESFTDAAAEIRDFNDDLEFIISKGFDNIAELLAGQGLEAGNAVADEISDALRAGNTALAEGLSTSIADLDSARTGIEDFFRNVLGPAVIGESLILGALSADSFGAGLDFSSAVRLVADLAKTTLSEEGRSIALIAATEGADAAQALGESMNLTQEVIDEAVAAGTALSTNEEILTGAKTAGAAAGASFIEGFLAPLLLGEGVVEATEGLANETETALRKALLGNSPSRVAMGVGRDFVAGFVLGLEDDAKALAAAKNLGLGAGRGLESTANRFALAAGGIVDGAASAFRHADLGQVSTSTPPATAPTPGPAGVGGATFGDGVHIDRLELTVSRPEDIGQAGRELNTELRALARGARRRQE